MTSPLAGLMSLWIALGPAGGASGRAEEPSGVQTVVLEGQVVELTEALKGSSIVFDAEPVAKQVVLRGADGTLTPLFSDDASRALFLDKRLRTRRAEVTGRRHPGIPYLQVVSFRVEEDGELRTPEYFCEVCTISVRYPQICPCCQGPMDLRMRPDSR
jgi:hypothetical protein